MGLTFGSTFICLNKSPNIVGSVEKSWKRVPTNLNWFWSQLNFQLTSGKYWIVLKPFKLFIRHLCVIRRSQLICSQQNFFICWGDIETVRVAPYNSYFCFQRFCPTSVQLLLEGCQADLRQPFKRVLMQISLSHRVSGTQDRVAQSPISTNPGLTVKQNIWMSCHGN